MVEEETSEEMTDLSCFGKVLVSESLLLRVSEAAWNELLLRRF